MKSSSAVNFVKGRGDLVYQWQNIEQKLISSVHALLSSKKMTIATAESCTSGLLAAALTEIGGSSLYFLGGVNTYSNEAKSILLNIPGVHIKSYGAVSSEVAELMAKNICHILKSDIGIAITGIAGPSGGTKVKPVGHVWLGVFSQKRGIRSMLLDFSDLAHQLEGNALRKAIRTATINETLNQVMLEVDPSAMTID